MGGVEDVWLGGGGWGVDAWPPLPHNYRSSHNTLSRTTPTPNNTPQTSTPSQHQHPSNTAPTPRVRAPGNTGQWRGRLRILLECILVLHLLKSHDANKEGKPECLSFCADHPSCPLVAIAEWGQSRRLPSYAASGCFAIGRVWRDLDMSII